MKSIAEDLKKTEQEAKEIYDAVMTNIKGLKNLMDESQDMARRLGYVEDKWGRRRHIPDMMLQPYELTSINKNTFDPFFDSAQLGVVDETEELKQKFIQELLNAKWKTQKDGIKERIAQAGFRLKENTKRIEDATRQCVNSRIQGRHMHCPLAA